MVFSRPPSLRINPCSFYLQWPHWRIPCIVSINKSFNVSSKIWQSKYVLGDMSPKCVFFWHFWKISQKYFALPPAPPCNSLGRTPLVPLPPSFNGATFTENWSGCQFTQNSSTSLASTPSTMPTCQIVLKFSFANIWDIFDNFCQFYLVNIFGNPKIEQRGNAADIFHEILILRLQCKSPTWNKWGVRAISRLLISDLGEGGSKLGRSRWLPRIIFISVFWLQIYFLH